MSLRAVWSFWTKPLFEKNSWTWLTEKHHLLAWILSFECAKKHYPETVLFTDDFGASILIDGLKLDFVEISLNLNALNKHDSQWWMLGKLYTYRAQEKPFVHIDSDVFLWKPLPERLEDSNLFAQNPEPVGFDGSWYRTAMLKNAIEKSKGWLPDEFHWYLTQDNQHAACCGIFGGNSIDFIRYYSNIAIEIIERNNSAWKILENKTYDNIIIEQYWLMACLEFHRNNPKSRFNNINISFLFNTLYEAFDPKYSTEAGYTHLIGSGKSDPLLSIKLEERVKKDYPHRYEICVRYLQDRGSF